MRQRDEPSGPRGPLSASQSGPPTVLRSRIEKNPFFPPSVLYRLKEKRSPLTYIYSVPKLNKLL